MIVLDTNVVSALMLPNRDPAVVSWLDGQVADLVWTSSITVLEIRFGLALLATGKRRRSLEEAFDRTVNEDLDGRVLPFDVEAAHHAATLAARRRLAGRPVDFRDAEIAGTAASQNAVLATGNTRHFEGLGLALVNPWKDKDQPR